MKYRINSNGSFSIIGNNIDLYDCYPGIDDRPLMPLAINISDDSITYELDNGKVVLRFEYNENIVKITPLLIGISGIHDFSLVKIGKIKNAINVYHLSFGMDDCSGWGKITNESIDSYGLLGVFNEIESIFAYSDDYRRYTLKFDVKIQEGLFNQTSNISCGFNLEGTICADTILPSVYFFSADNLRVGLDSCAKEISKSMNARKPNEPAYHWCSWYYMYQNFSQEYLEEYIKGFKSKNQTDFKYIQIDAGYFKSHGDWLVSNYRFTEGLKKAASTIINAGYKAGIWIGPFMIGEESNVYKHHKEWLLKDLDDNLVTKLKSYSEPKTWGCIDSNYYVLDMTHPDAKEYMRLVFRSLKSYGFTLFKTDFLLWNMIDSSLVKRYDSSLTSVEIMRNTLELIREEIGDESYLLGCIAPFMPLIGLVDAVRISGDMGAQWDGDFGPGKMMQDICADNFMNNVFWQNDPDSMIIREFDTHFSDEETKSLVLLQALSGGVITTSDPIHRLSDSSLSLLEFVKPSKVVSAQIPYIGTDERLIIITHSLPQGYLLFVMNPGTEDAVKLLSFKELLNEDSLFAYKWDLKSDIIQSQKVDKLYISVNRHESALYFLTSDMMQFKPKNIWEW